MPIVDLPVEQLRAGAPQPDEPADLDEFWAASVAEARAFPVRARFEPADTGLTVVDSRDGRFAGWGGHPVAAWLHTPAGATGPLPCVIQYVGYGRGRGLPHELMLWAAAGYAHLVVDARGQGSIGEVGVTPDPVATDGAGAPAYPGFMTRGVASPQSYYFRRLFTDAVRAVDAARAHPLVDPDRIVVCGASQGGAQAIAAAALAGGVRAALVDVPFLANIARAVDLTDTEPYAEVSRYLALHRDQGPAVLRTLSYVDVASLARRATAPALFSVGLRDVICPPSTVYAAYQSWAGPKELAEYPYNGHEGGGPFQAVRQLRWLTALLDR